MISIKRFLSQDETGTTLAQVVRLLVRGINEHAIFGEAGEASRFRDHARRFAAKFEHGVDPDHLLTDTGALMDAFEEHNLLVSRHWSMQAIELQHMVQMLTATVRTVSSASTVNVAKLGEIEKQVTSLRQIDDVRMIKTRLSDCLDDIRKETERQRSETRETIEQLSQGLEQVRSHSVEIGALPNDAVTGLPQRQAAEAALTAASQESGQCYAAVLAVDRLQALNVRFGREVGDAVLAAFARMARAKLEDGDRVYRWSGPALVALLPRTSSLERVRIEIGRIAETRLEHTIETPSRSIMLPITARWTVLPMMAAPRLMFQKIDAFAAAPGTRE